MHAASAPCGLPGLDLRLHLSKSLETRVSFRYIDIVFEQLADKASRIKGPNVVPDPVTFDFPLIGCCCCVTGPRHSVDFRR